MGGRMIISNAGLCLMSVLCLGITLLLGHVFDIRNLVKFPDVGGLVSQRECELMFSAAATQSAHPGAAKNLIFGLGLAGRIEAGMFLAIFATGIYTMACVPFEQRHPVHFMFAMVAIMAFCIDGNTAGIVPFGTSRWVTGEAKAGAVALMGVWSVIASCNVAAFMLCRSAAAKLTSKKKNT